MGLVYHIDRTSKTLVFVCADGDHCYLLALLVSYMDLTAAALCGLDVLQILKDTVLPSDAIPTPKRADDPLGVVIRT
jgi:hypothetical protein